VRSGSQPATPALASPNALTRRSGPFNAAVAGHHDARMLSVAVHDDGRDLRAGLNG